MELLPITRRIVCIAGFAQRRNAATGIERVWQHLHSAVKRPHSTVVDLLRWSDDMDSYVGHCLRTGPLDHRDLVIDVVAYSWGVGKGALSLADALLQQGLGIRRLISCDGVYYSPWLPGRALINHLFAPQIVIPDNVQRVDYLRQSRTKPAGHAITPANRVRTEVYDRTPPGLGSSLSHTSIDNSDAFLDLALELVQ
jgi:hypothetical protein